MRTLLLMCLCCFWAAQATAQSYFNKRETLHSRAAVLTSVLPYGNNYYVFGKCLDSINYVGGGMGYNIWGIKFTKFGTDGTIIIDTVFQKPGIRPNITAWYAKVILQENNTFLVPADNIDTNHVGRLAIYCFDTLGQILWEKEYEPPTYSDSSFWRMEDLKPTGDGNWLILSTIYVPSSGNTSQINLTKLDQDFNLIWHNHYGDTWKDGAGKILIESDGSYLISGRRSNQVFADPIKLIGQVEFFRTDTSGNILLQWRSDTSHLHSVVQDVIQTSDGGYIYIGAGEGWQDPTNLNSFFYNGWIEKLDSDFNTEWGRIIGVGDNSVPYRVYEKENGDIHVFGQMLDTPVTETNFNIDGYWLTLNGATGATLRTRKYHGIRSEYDRNTFYDARPTPDGGYIMVGDANDQGSSVIYPNDRAWIVKVDSTGCLGPDDPQCQPTGVALSGIAHMQLAVYPNPVSDQLTIALPQGIAAQLEILDMQGRVSLRQPLQGGTQQVNTQGLSAGNYLYRIKVQGGLIATGKLVKQ